MNRDQEIALLEELVGLREAGAQFLDEEVGSNSVQNYVSQSRFDEEQAKLFRALPTMVAHRSELTKPGDFVRREVGGRSLLITRDEDGAAHVFSECLPASGRTTCLR